MTISSESNATPSGIARSYLRLAQVQPDPSLPKSTKYGLRLKNSGQYLIADLSAMDDGSDFWTNNQTNAHVYYDLENAFRCAGILASIAGKDVEVVQLDA